MLNGGDEIEERAEISCNEDTKFVVEEHNAVVYTRASV